jgi:hypothetical protein
VVNEKKKGPKKTSDLASASSAANPEDDSAADKVNIGTY